MTNTVVVGLSGGLGNQMYQYAAGIALAQRLEVALAMDLSWFLSQSDRQFGLDRFAVRGSVLPIARLPARLVSLQSRIERRCGWRRYGVPIFREQHFHFDRRFNLLKHPVFLHGAWQSESYFANAATIVRKEFRLTQPLTEGRDGIAVAISKETQPVSVHVRRGDYVSNRLASAYHGTCDPAWYAEAKLTLEEQVADAKYFVFSDDPAWAKSNLREFSDAVFIEPSADGRDEQDMHLMSLCHHHIIANSSFSWWGAWLNPRPAKLVIAPRRWFAGAAHDTRDLIPDGWIRL